jgi:hypothetical protein
VIATAARDPHGAYGDADGPAGPIWGLWTPRSGESVARRHRLAELPQRGPSVEHSASNTAQPLNEAAFDPDGREMSRRIHTAQSEPAEEAGYADDDDDLDDVTLYDDADDDDDVYRAPAAPARPERSGPGGHAGLPESPVPARGSRTLPPCLEEVTDDDVTRENDSDDGRAGPLASACRLCAAGKSEPVVRRAVHRGPAPNETTPRLRDRSGRDTETTDKTSETRTLAPCLAVSETVSLNVSGGQWEGSVNR